MDINKTSSWSTAWSTELVTGTWRSQKPVHLDRPSPCSAACPIGQNISRWIKEMQEENYYSAWQMLTEANPLPAVSGRVCQHPCEKECNRGCYDSAININALEQWLGDMAIQKGWQFTLPREELPLKVAIIGGGPAGLSCAYHLRRHGVSVLLYEAQAEPGGMLRYGIPSYRLPKEILRAEIARLEKFGVGFRLEHSIEQSEGLAVLAKEHAAVFLAPGAPLPEKLPLDFASCKGIGEGIDFLMQINSGAKPHIGKKVAVVGGGSTAIDVSRAARRLGAAVNLLTLETLAAMPASPAEIAEAREEGVQIHNETTVAGFDSAGGCLRSLLLQKIKFLGSDAAGRPIFEEKAEKYMLAVDTLIVAIGQKPAWEKETAISSKENVFVGGDAFSEQQTVAAAIGSGRRAAEKIIYYVSGGDRANIPGEAPAGQSVSEKEINCFYFSPQERLDRDKLAPAERIASFHEVIQGLDLARVKAEAGRCFICGRCTSCDNCFYFCPDMAIKRPENDGDLYQVLAQYCKGCGICQEECPRGAVIMEVEKK